MDEDPTPVAPAKSSNSASSSKGKGVDYESLENEIAVQKTAALQEGKLDMAIEALLNLEKQMRLAADVVGTRKVVVAIVQLCYEAQAWKMLNDQIVLLSKRRSQLKQAVIAMVQQCMQYIDQAPDLDTQIDLIKTLNTVSTGKIYVEIERAHLIKKLAKIKEAQGLITEAAELMQEVAVLDVFAAVEELHSLSAKEMNKLLRDSQNSLVLRLKAGRGSFTRVGVERLVLALPLHLLACLASRGAEPRLRYLLHGFRLLHSLSDLALRHQKLEQIMLQEVKLREQILDLIIYMLITLASTDQDGRIGSSFTLLHAALVACSLYLLPAFVATEWSDVVPVLLAHPKVEIFMDSAFDAVRRDIALLQSKLRVLNSKLLNKKITSSAAECIAQVVAQQCEASVQVLQSLCQSHAFTDKLLNHKELCRNGGLLHLALVVLKLQLPSSLNESKYLVSLIFRLQSKILSLLVKFCETEPVSFLDEVAADARSMRLAEIVAREVLSLVRVALREDHRKIQGSSENSSPTGLLFIHAMRLADIFSDDSNFRNLVMDHITSDLTKVLAQAPTIFSSGWCLHPIGLDTVKSGSDAMLVYDPFRAAGAVLQSFKGSMAANARPSGSLAPLPDEYSGCSLSSEQIQPATFAQERASLFVKILANLHCFNPDICAADEKDRFLTLFVESLTKGPFNPADKSFFLSTVQTAVRICENLFLLLEHVSSLPSEVVSDEDLQLVSTFYDALHDVICPSGDPDPSLQEDPVVAYVRDAHEQKRRMMLAQRLESERWQRILHFSGPSDKEQSTSINKTIKKPPSQPNIENTSRISEDSQSTGNRSSAKRKTDIKLPEDEQDQPQKEKGVFEQRGGEEKESEWFNAEELESKRQMDSEMEIETWGRETLKEAACIEGYGEQVEGMKDAMVEEIDQKDCVVIKQNKSVKNIEMSEDGDMQIENQGDETFNHQENRNDRKSVAVPIYEIKQVDIIHVPKVGEINSGPGVKTEYAIDEIDFKTETDMGQESSQSVIGNTRGGSVESELRVNDVNRIQKGTVNIVSYEEMQPKKRKRNIMNEKQTTVIENALKTEPDMQRYPKLIQQWTTQLNKIGPELSYQQLKNWLNNRRARLARQAREARGLESEVRARSFESEAASPLESIHQSRSAPRHDNNNAGNPGEQKGNSTEDGNTRESGGLKRTNKLGKAVGSFRSKQPLEDEVNMAHMDLDAYYKHGCEFSDIGKAPGSSRRSTAVKFVKCEVGQYVSLLDKDGNEVALGIVHQVEGKWEGEKLDEQGLCIVKISKLKVDKSVKLPHPSPQLGTTFEDAENLFGYMVVVWDTNRIFLIS